MTKLTKLETRRVRAALNMAIAFEGEYGDNIAMVIDNRVHVDRRHKTKSYLAVTKQHRLALAKSRRTTAAFARLLTRLSHER